MLISTSLGDFYFNPYKPHAPIVEKWKWKTDIIDCIDGSEERLFLRDNPRLEVKMIIEPSQYGGRYLNNLLYKNLRDDWLIPLWYEEQQISSITNGASTVTVDTDNVEFYAGGLFLIWDSPDNYEIAEISSFNSTTITLDGTVQNDYTAPYIVPCRYGRILGDPDRRTNGYKNIFEINFESKDSKQISVSTPTQYNSNDIYVDEIFAEGELISNAFLRQIYISDGDVGVFEQSSIWNKSKNSKTFKYIEQGLQNIHNLRKFLHRRRGKYLPFYQPSFEFNMNLQSTGNITSAILIENDNYKSYLNNIDHVAFYMNDGSWNFAQVTDSIVFDSDTDQLNISPSLNEDASNVSYVSLLELKRLNTDDVEITHVGNRTATTNLPVLSVT